jgi:hypothetical protein
MITSTLPKSWRDLQDAVARILHECSFSVETDKPISTPRGAVIIDISAEETVQGRINTILCECKYWKRRIPQSVIHSFRTVMSDIGANHGYIISLRGFQSGSISAAKSTNIHLVTLDEFQNNFEETWLHTYFTPTITRELDQLFSFIDPVAVPRDFFDLSPSDQDHYREVFRKWDDLGAVCMLLSEYGRRLGLESVIRLPIISDKRKSLSRLPQDVLRAEGYRELLDCLLSNGIEAIDDFKKALKR